MADTTFPAEAVEHKRIPMFQPGHTLEAMRDAGHSLSTALAEVVDNSIEAKANHIWLRLEEGTNERGKKCVHRIAIGDDGEGMDPRVLHCYLIIGFSTRWMQTDTIGKYGVGAKMAALNFGRRIDVWSRKDASKPWLHVNFDLDEAIAEEDRGETVGIDPPKDSDLPEEFREIMPGDTGTLVVWSRVDRLEHGRVTADFDELQLDVQQKLSRIFRYFLDGGIELKVNKKALLPHDPLFLLERTWADKVLTETLAKSDSDGGQGKPKFEHYGAQRLTDETIKVKGSRVRLRVTLYPREVIRQRGKGGDTLANRLRVPENEGAISFVRMDREVSYTNVPRIFPDGVQDIDRFIGIEVSFAPELDDFFGIRHVKRGVEPHGELRDKVRARLKTFIPQARQMIQEIWGQAQKEGKTHAGEHAEIMEAVKDAARTMPKGRATGAEGVAAEQIYLDLAMDTGHANDEEEQREYIERIKQMPYVLESVDFPGNQFLDIQHVDGRVIIRVNTRHRFYREIWGPLRELVERGPGAVSGQEAVRASGRAVQGLALMVVAYGKAQSMHENPKEQYDELTQYWGQFLDNLMGKVKDAT